MNSRWTRRAWQLLMLGLPILALVTGAAWVVSRHQALESALAQLEPRHARLLGLLAEAGAIQQRHEQLAVLLTQQAYPATLDATQAGNEAQQRVREAFTQGGLAVQALQVLPAKEEGRDFEKITITLAAEGELIQFQQALGAVAQLQPAVAVDSASLRLIGRAPSGAPRLSGQFSLSILRTRG